jgi:FixJ family two-component response regulator
MPVDAVIHVIAQAKSIIAVVEDDDGMRRALERLLRIAGFHPLLFRTAEAFLGDQSAQSAACVVLDIHLPGLSGLELRRRMSAAGNQQPVIFITAEEDDSMRREAEQLDCSAYLRKPFEGIALLNALRKVLSIN